MIVAAFARWHARHDAAREALSGVTDLVAHAELEAYSVLTRLPAPHRAPSKVVADFLRQRFPGSRLALPSRDRLRLVPDLASRDLTGGAVYDALIAATAMAHEYELLTCDRRASTVYRTVGARWVAV